MPSGYYCILTSGGAFRAGRGSQRRVRSLSILYAILSMGSELESSGDFSMRCQCLTINLLRRCVGRCGEYVVVKGVHLQHVVCLLAFFVCQGI